jgi:hypothetical protein
VTPRRVFNRFARSGGQSGVITCRLCGKKTRETGEGEGAAELCKRCLYVTYAENYAADYGVNSPEHICALAMIPTKREAS